jgi:addiction module HigA family antidote
VTADTALRLARYFGSSEKFWLGLQDDYNLELAKEKLGKSIQKIAVAG